ncbi:Eukaryotic peptide chain release factor GTP-binding subunit [Yamadazyma tenuis]|uniref:Palmitoyltransferase n=1 Tax=Candida tenuis (strain ATCC 10573 / BCRC 21748 / CBS 615 / JCM 9827 / NBRC 10315 / NRRL Y-1498 / VKM Y-70) TaxID=590646 RepID=G3AX72_CANTC|nr:zf-DHHC-domain-containing protein [Yamadazyma tenuis ATCC 10573]EGV66705.1 zf-DHHC-domain-containing protein [Yamadazyma tenuis ATCC 10573]WEJ95162.1 Eukaryotic peptide chain release factor GTP-binding subunit [Yamadazyma tenuis]
MCTKQIAEPAPWFYWFLTNWLVADPKYIVLNQSGSYKNYQAQKQEGLKFVYLVGGRLRVVKTLPINVFVASVLTGLAVLFWVFEARWTWNHLSPALPIVFSYLWLITLAMFIKAATSDPGILPRNVHMPYDLRLPTNTTAPDEYFNAISLPYLHDKFQGVTVKYCSTCHIWRPPRASHCGVCNACVVNHDHHCIYINNCVGLRNYKYFLWFVLGASACGIMAIITGLIHVFHYKTAAEFSIHTFGQSISSYPGSFCLVILSLMAIVYPFLVLLVHILLTCQNLTTREYLNFMRSNKDWKNVFDRHNLLKNLYINWIGRARGTSYLRLTDQYDPEDIRLQRVAPLE